MKLRRWGVIAVLPIAGLVAASSRVLGAPAKPAGSAKASASASAVPTAMGPKPLAETLSGPAKDDYDAGMTAYSLKDFGGASIKFSAAHDKAKDARLLFNLASCEKNLRHYVKMRTHLQRYLAEGGALLTQKDREDAEALIAAIEPFISTLKVVVDQPGADVLIDDEVAGKTPLEKPIAVDLGSRKVRIHKEGFKDFEATIVVGGDKEAVVEAKLIIVVTGATLKINAPAGAHIFIDNEEVGVGTWQGKLAAGGHPLRVSAPGMLTHQSEVVLLDGDARVVDVVLDPAGEKVGPAAPLAPSGPTFTMGLRTGYGTFTRNGGAGVAPLWLDLGFHLGRAVIWGIYLQAGKITTGKSCATAAHGPTAASSADLEMRYSFDSCAYGKVGVELIVHTLPSADIDPWIGFDFGFMVQGGKARTYDPLGGASTDSVNTGALQPGLQLGVDWHVTPSYRPFTVGPFFASSLNIYGSDKFDRFRLSSTTSGGVTTSGDNGRESFGIHHSENGFGFSLLFGARAALTF